MNAVPSLSIVPIGEAEPRQVPHNFEAEQALLGALLMNNRAIERVDEFLRPEHFASAAHAKIFQACLDLVAHNQIANPVTLKTHLAGDPHLAELGGDIYLSRLAGSAASIINAEDYGRIVVDLHLRRELIALGEDIVNDAFDTDFALPGTSQIEMAEQRLFKLGGDAVSTSGPTAISASLRKALDSAEALYRNDGSMRGIATGFADYDAKTGGLHQSDLVILAGRPSMGKTALATNIAVHIAKNAGTVLFFSLEMSAEQLSQRILSAKALVPGHKFQSGRFTDIEMQRLSEAQQELDALDMQIDDSPALTVAAIRTRSRRVARQKGLVLVVIDYLQLIGTPAARGRNSFENRNQEVSDITRGLKALAKELKVPVVALSQLSRDVEKRDDKRPQLADLRDSGSIEQDADVVAFCYREEYYLERSEPSTPGKKLDDWNARMEASRGLGEVIIGKQRRGPTGTIKLQFNAALTVFYNLSRYYE